MPRRKSLCTRIKTGRKKCTRFNGCKYANGTKRRYCRTRKNRRS